MELALIGAEELKSLYETRLREDFPPGELRPYDNMKYLLDKGLYRCFVCREAGELLGYALFVVSGGAALLDYYAVSPAYRGQGVGTRFFEKLTHTAAELGVSLILIEAESLESAVTPEETEERERRFRFYRRCGCRETRGYSFLFGVEYRILAFCLDQKTVLSDSELLSQLEGLYRKVIPTIIGDDEEAFHRVCRCFLREEQK